MSLYAGVLVSIEILNIKKNSGFVQVIRIYIDLVESYHNAGSNYIESFTDGFRNFIQIFQSMISARFSQEGVKLLNCYSYENSHLLHS